jgi:voltage-gated sodium channel
MLYNSIMFPPAFDDLQIWIDFRTAVNNTLKLKTIVTHLAFQIFTAILIMLCFANAVILLFNGPPLTAVFDQVFVWIFVAELLVRVVGVGPENFFADRWNNVDAFLIVVNVVFLFVSTGTRIDNLFKINRIFRIAGPIRAFLHSKWVESFHS